MTRQQFAIQIPDFAVSIAINIMEGITSEHDPECRKSVCLL